MKKTKEDEKNYINKVKKREISYINEYFNDEVKEANSKNFESYLMDQRSGKLIHKVQYQTYFTKIKF